MVTLALMLLVSMDLLDQVLKSERVGSFNGEAESSTPNLGGHDTKSSRNAKEHCVVVELVQAVVHEEGAGAGVNVGPGVADLAGGLKHVGDHSVAGLDEAHEVVVLDVLVSECELAHEARVSLAKDGVAISWDDLAAGKCILHVLSDVIFCPLVAKFSLEIEKEFKALLICETVKWTGKSIHSSRE